MSIDFGPRIECSVCKVPKQATNHWFRVWPEPRQKGVTDTRLCSQLVAFKIVVISELLPEDIQAQSNLIPGEEHACGEMCLGKLVIRMAVKEFGVRTPTAEAAEDVVAMLPAAVWQEQDKAASPAWAPPPPPARNIDSGER